MTTNYSSIAVAAPEAEKWSASKCSSSNDHLFCLQKQMTSPQATGFLSFFLELLPVSFNVWIGAALIDRGLSQAVLTIYWITWKEVWLLLQQSRHLPEKGHSDTPIISCVYFCHCKIAHDKLFKLYPPSLYTQTSHLSSPPLKHSSKSLQGIFL